jgi:hypothetical protein
MREKGFHISRNSSEEENKMPDQKVTVEEEEEEREEEENIVDASEDIKNLLQPTRLKTQHWVALLIVTTFCIITVLFAVVAVIKGDANMFEKIWSVLGPLIGAIVGYLFARSRT